MRRPVHPRQNGLRNHGVCRQGTPPPHTTPHYHTTIPNFHWFPESKKILIFGPAQWPRLFTCLFFGFHLTALRTGRQTQQAPQVDPWASQGELDESLHRGIGADFEEIPSPNGSAFHFGEILPPPFPPPQHFSFFLIVSSFFFDRFIPQEDQLGVSLLTKEQLENELLRNRAEQRAHNWTVSLDSLIFPFPPWELCRGFLCFFSRDTFMSPSRKNGRTAALFYGKRKKNWCRKNKGSCVSTVPSCEIVRKLLNGAGEADFLVERRSCTGWPSRDAQKLRKLNKCHRNRIL